MVGLGEARTHIGAILFHIETASHKNDSATWTQKECQWVIPTYLKDIPYASLRKLDFSSAKSKKYKINFAIDRSTTAPVKDVVKRDHPGQDVHIRVKKAFVAG